MSPIITINDIGSSLLLLQLNDALFPIGGYTQSYGLETYVQYGLVTDAVTVSDYCRSNLLNSLCYNDLLAVKLAFQAVSQQDWNGLIELDLYCTALKAPREIRQASSKLGGRFIKNIQALGLVEADGILASYVCEITNNQLSGHLALVYGVLCAEQHIELGQVLLNFLYAQLSAMINNAVKLVPLSQTAGQQILYDLHTDLGRALELVMSLSIVDLGRSTPSFELRAMQHETLYSRLYMS